MTQQTPAEILAEVDQQASQSSVPPALQPRIVRQGPKGKTAKSADPLSLDEDFTESSRPATSARGRGSTSRSTTSRASTPTSLPTDDEVEGVEGQVAVLLLLAGGTVGMVLPVTGMTLTMRARVGAHAICEVARTNPKLWKRLTGFLKASKYASLAQVGASVAAALAVDLHVVKPESMMPQATIKDVLELFRTMSDEPSTTEQNGQAPQEPSYAGSVFASAGSNGDATV